MSAWRIFYRCNNCGESFDRTAAGDYKSQVAATIAPQLHTCPNLQSDNPTRRQGIAIGYAIERTT